MDFLRNLFGKKQTTASAAGITRTEQPSLESPPAGDQHAFSQEKISIRHAGTIQENWDRKSLVEKGYASADTMRAMMVYRVLIPEGTPFDPSRDMLALLGSKVVCGVCITNGKIKPVPGSTIKAFALKAFTLRLKGPLDSESKHLAKCPHCGSQIQICGDELPSPAGSEYLLTVWHTIAPPSYLNRGTVDLPRLMVDQIGVAVLKE